MTEKTTRVPPPNFVLNSDAEQSKDEYKNHLIGSYDGQIKVSKRNGNLPTSTQTCASTAYKESIPEPKNTDFLTNISQIKLTTHGSNENQHALNKMLFKEINSSEPNVTLIENLLLDGADPNAKDDKGNTPLHYAASLNSKDIDKVVEILTKHGAKVNTTNGLGQTPLHRAKNDKSVRVLLQLGADPNAKDDKGNTPLHYAASLNSKHINTLNALIEYEAKVNEANKLGQTPLHRTRSFKFAIILLEKGADPNAKDIDDNTPLHYAASLKSKYINVLKALIKHKADVNATNDDGETPLHKVRSYEGVKILFDSGADLNAKDAIGNIPLHEVASSPLILTDVADFLIMNGSQVNEPNDDQETPLHRVTSEEMTEKLLKHGADPNAKDVGGNTPLHCRSALLSKYPGIITLLIRGGANVNETNNSGQTPVHLALIFYSELSAKIIPLLLESGADVTAKDPKGKIALHSALLSKAPTDALFNLLLKYTIEQSKNSPNKSYLMDENVDEMILKKILINLLAHTEKTCPLSIKVPKTHQERVDYFNQKMSTLINEN